LAGGTVNTPLSKIAEALDAAHRVLSRQTRQARETGGCRCVGLDTVVSWRLSPRPAGPTRFMPSFPSPSRKIVL